jgi:hypothetical protein
VSVAPGGSLTLSISFMRSPNTVPWPQPVVLVRLAVFFARSLRPARVLTTTDSVSQSTCTATMSSSFSTSRWLRRYPIASASGAAPSVMIVRSSCLST